MTSRVEAETAAATQDAPEQAPEAEKRPEQATGPEEAQAREAEEAKEAQAREAEEAKEAQAREEEEAKEEARGVKQVVEAREKEGRDKEQERETEREEPDEEAGRSEEQRDPSRESRARAKRAKGLRDSSLKLAQPGLRSRSRSRSPPPRRRVRFRDESEHEQQQQLVELFAQKVLRVQEVKEGLQEVRQGLQEVRQSLQEVKQGLQEQMNLLRKRVQALESESEKKSDEPDHKGEWAQFSLESFVVEKHWALAHLLVDFVACGFSSIYSLITMVGVNFKSRGLLMVAGPAFDMYVDAWHKQNLHSSSRLSQQERSDFWSICTAHVSPSFGRGLEDVLPWAPSVMDQESRKRSPNLHYYSGPLKFIDYQVLARLKALLVQRDHDRKRAESPFKSLKVQLNDLYLPLGQGQQRQPCPALKRFADCKSWLSWFLSRQHRGSDDVELFSGSSSSFSAGDFYVLPPGRNVSSNALEDQRLDWTFRRAPSSAKRILFPGLLQEQKEEKAPLWNPGVHHMDFQWRASSCSPPRSFREDMGDILNSDDRTLTTSCLAEICFPFFRHREFNLEVALARVAEWNRDQSLKTIQDWPLSLKAEFVKTLCSEMRVPLPGDSGNKDAPTLTITESKVQSPPRPAPSSTSSKSSNTLAIPTTSPSPSKGKSKPKAKSRTEKQDRADESKKRKRAPARKIPRKDKNKDNKGRSRSRSKSKSPSPAPSPSRAPPKKKSSLTLSRNAVPLHLSSNQEDEEDAEAEEAPEEEEEEESEARAASPRHGRQPLQTDI